MDRSHRNCEPPTLRRHKHVDRMVRIGRERAATRIEDDRLADRVRGEHGEAAAREVRHVERKAVIREAHLPHVLDDGRKALADGMSVTHPGAGRCLGLFKTHRLRRSGHRHRRHRGNQEPQPLHNRINSFVLLGKGYYIRTFWGNHPPYAPHLCGQFAQPRAQEPGIETSSPVQR